MLPVLRQCSERIVRIAPISIRAPRFRRLRPAQVLAFATSVG